MYECPTRRRTTRESTVCSFPLSPQFESELIALARRCITLCVRFLSILCFCECLCVLGRLVSPVRLRLRSLPHLSCVFVLFSFPRAHTAFPCGFLPIEPVR